MTSFALSQCYVDDSFDDINDSGSWTANETLTEDCNGNGVFDANSCLVDCEAEFKIDSITANGDGTYNLAVYYKSTEPMGGYQIVLRSDDDSTPGVNNPNALNITGNVGGDLTGSGLTVSGNVTTLAFSFTGGAIPASADWTPLLTFSAETSGSVADGESVILDAVNNSDSGFVVSSTSGGALVAEFYDAVWSVGSESISLDNDMINPYSYSLKNNYPNPFNPSTTIEYSVAEISDVNISIYDASGRLVKNLISSQHVPGDSYQVSWNGTNEAGTSVAAGMYFYKINAGSFVETKKMLLIK